MNRETCGYPLRKSGDPCRRKPTVKYSKKGETIYRCRDHDSRTVRDYATEAGWERSVL